jgi:hypothetical protein
MGLSSLIKTVGKPEINQVNQVLINGYQLPLDVIISLNGRKIIAESQIVDGVEVFERIARKSARITFDFTLRGIIKDTTRLGVPLDRYVFPMSSINPLWDATRSQDIMEFFKIVWVPDEVVNIKNVVLNGLGISQIIVGDSYDMRTTRGSVDVGIVLKAIENYYSVKLVETSLISNNDENFA